MSTQQVKPRIREKEKHMTIQRSSVAVERALAKKTNAVGMCQQITREYFDAPSAGDRDRDGDADAADGYYSEPSWAKHAGDRNPPEGKPLYFSKDGGAGNGHRALSLKGGQVRSSDFNSTTKRYDAGVMGTGTIAEVERAMGIKYIGWTETISGFAIPPEIKVVRNPERPQLVQDALKAIRAELRKSDVKHKHLLNEAKKLLLEIPKS